MFYEKRRLFMAEIPSENHSERPSRTTDIIWRPGDGLVKRTAKLGMLAAVPVVPVAVMAAKPIGNVLGEVRDRVGAVLAVGYDSIVEPVVSAALMTPQAVLNAGVNTVKGGLNTVGAGIQGTRAGVNKLMQGAAWFPKLVGFDGLYNHFDAKSTERWNSAKNQLTGIKNSVKNIALDAQIIGASGVNVATGVLSAPALAAINAVPYAGESLDKSIGNPIRETRSGIMKFVTGQTQTFIFNTSTEKQKEKLHSLAA